LKESWNEMPKHKKNETMDPDDLRDSVKADEHYRRFRRIVKNIAQEINIEKLHAELLRLHSGRKSRTLFVKRPSVDTVQEAGLQDSAYRSRMAEIYVEVDYHLGMLAEAVDKIRKHFIHEYRDNMEGLKTKGERLSYADQYIQSGLSLMHKLKRLLSTADVFIKDIDQTGYSFKNTIKTLEILYSHKNDKKSI
jgi:hypothetical protein